MDQEDDPVFTNPEAYGIENLEAPGEPDRDHMGEVSPVPGTGRQARQEHMREHDDLGRTASDTDFRDRVEREEASDAFRE